MNDTATALRLGAAVALLVGGLVHLQLYFDGYRGIDKIGPSFLLNAVASGVLVVAVANRPEWPIRLAGIGLAAGSIVAFILSRTGDGLFDFKETGLNPSPQALIALVAESSAILLLAATFLPAVQRGSTATASSPRLIGASVATVAIIMVGLGIYWSAKSDDDGVVAPGSDATVIIRDFAFIEPTLEVSEGTTITWRNTDPFAHTVVAQDESFNSGKLDTGSTFDHTFDTAGTFAYFCGIHPSMTATITVTG